MGAMTNLTAADGHRLAAYVAEPKGAPKGGVVVIQEIFGVNGHIKAVTDGFAADGYYAVAPALFDRVQRDVDPFAFRCPGLGSWEKRETTSDRQPEHDRGSS